VASEAEKSGAVTGAPERSDGREILLVEPRWPVALAILTFIAISVGLRIGVLIPGIEFGLLACLVAADPGHLARRRRWLRRIAILLVLALAAATLLSTGILIRDLIVGGKVTNQASSLLASGAVIWLGNVLVFSLIYWLLDSGGPVARYLGERPYPDFAFSQQMSPELAPPGWHAMYVDYLILGLTTSTAFSPTDVMPMTAWPKLTMALQSIIALSVVGLVIARAVNVFS
jgi:hypothetical protein